MRGKCKKCGQAHSKLGVEISNGTLKRTARSSVHLLKMLDAWAFNADLIDKHDEVNTIVVYDQDGGKRYSISRERFMMYATRATFSPFYGAQLALARSGWELDHTPEPEHVEAAEQPVLSGFSSYTTTRWGKPVPKWMIGKE